MSGGQVTIIGPRRNSVRNKELQELISQAAFCTDERPSSATTKHAERSKSAALRCSKRVCTYKFARGGAEGMPLSDNQLPRV
jgi:hypothetical protein